MFSLIAVVNTKGIFRYNFGAPLSYMHTCQLSRIECEVHSFVDDLTQLKDIVSHAPFKCPHISHHLNYPHQFFPWSYFWNNKILQTNGLDSGHRSPLIKQLLIAEIFGIMSDVIAINRQNLCFSSALITKQ